MFIVAGFVSLRHLDIFKKNTQAALEYMQQT